MVTICEIIIFYKITNLLIFKSWKKKYIYLKILICGYFVNWKERQTSNSSSQFTLDNLMSAFSSTNKIKINLSIILFIDLNLFRETTIMAEPIQGGGHPKKIRANYFPPFAWTKSLKLFEHPAQNSKSFILGKQSFITMLNEWILWTSLWDV